MIWKKTNNFCFMFYNKHIHIRELYKKKPSQYITQEPVSFSFLLQYVGNSDIQTDLRDKLKVFIKELESTYPELLL